IAPFYGRAVGTELVSPERQPIVLAPGEQQVHVIDVPADTAALNVRLTAAGPTEATLALGLFYFDEEQQAWGQIATGGRKASVLHVQPRPGQYAVLVSGSNVPATGVQAV